jgi:hypothetical protein
MVTTRSSVGEDGLVDVTHYGGGWVGYPPIGPTTPRQLRPKPVATYQATVPADIAESSITLAANIDQDALVAALNRRPEYMPFVWPDRELRDEADLRSLALVKILAVVSFGTDWPSLDPADILAHARSLDPDLTARTRPWLRVQGEVVPNGDASFGVEDIPDDDLPSPDILDTKHDPFIRATVGAELVRLIGEQRGSFGLFRMPLAS